MFIERPALLPVQIIISLVLAFLSGTATGWATVGSSSNSTYQNPVERDRDYGAIRFATEGYFSNQQKNESVYPSLEAMGKWSESTRAIEGSARGNLVVMPMGTDAYFEFPEAYVGTAPGLLGQVQFHAGRKFQDWSRIDQSWGLGQFEPRFRRDYLNPQRVGLLGLFASVKSESVYAVAYGSPLFIPDRGLPIYNCNDLLCSPSPWFISPSRRFSVLNKDTPAQYHLNLPPTEKIIQHWNAAAMVRIGGQRGFWGSLAYAYKPINQLLLGAEGYLDMPDEDGIPNSLPLEIYPRVAYQHLASLDYGFESERWSGWMSALYDHPVRDKTPSTWITQEVSRSLALSPGLEWRLGDLANIPTRLNASYIYQWGGDAPIQGPFPFPDRIFEKRNSFKNAVQGGAQFALPAFLGREARNVSVNQRWTYDITHQGSIWSTQLSYRYKRAWNFGIGADFLTSYSANRGESENDFIARYRSNDRVYAGVTYVF